MSWVKIDDRFPDHPKLLKLGDDYDACVSLHLRGLCYCASNLTDGFIPSRVFSGDERTIGLLMGIRLWEKCAGGHRIHDYLDYNPSCEEVIANKAALSKERSDAGKLGAAARWHGKDSKGNGKGYDKEHGKRHGPVPPPVTPTHVNPSTCERDSVESYFTDKIDREITPEERSFIERMVPKHGADSVKVALGYAIQEGARSICGYARDVLETGEKV